MMKSGIYIIRNATTDKVYVGSSVNIGRRWNAHRSELRRGIHWNTHLQASLDLYGEVSFVFDVLELCDTASLLIREQHWIDVLDAANNDVGYNLCPNSSNCLGCKISESHKAALRKLRLGTTLSEATKEKIRIASLGDNNHFYGRAHTERTKAILSQAKRGSKASEETRNKLSVALTGRKFSVEHREKIGEANKRRVVSAEARLKMSAAKKGKKLSPEHRLKMSLAAKNRRKHGEDRSHSVPGQGPHEDSTLLHGRFGLQIPN